MTYRPLGAADVDRFAQLEIQSFSTNPDRAQLAADAATLRGLFAGERQVAQLQLFSLRVLSGAADPTTGAAQMLPCGGIGSVAVSPAARRQGYAAALLRHACDELRAQGTALCLLYPFKPSFYHRYGWALCMERRLYRGAPALLAGFRFAGGGFVQVGPEAAAELQQIYAGALRGRFGPLDRDAAWWGRRVLHGWAKDDTYDAFIWRDAGGAGRSYVICRVSGAPGERILLCREAVARDPEARAQIFAFMAGYQGQCAEVQFRGPADAPVNLLLPDPLRCEVEPHFMLRLVDVAGALGALAYPAGLSGRLAIAVADDWLEHNRGVFALEVQAGRAECRRLAGDSPADLSCDVRVLAQIYTRHLRPRTAAAFGLLQAHSRPALSLAEQLFAGLAPYSSDLF
jgi:predicted acetyltransferase